MFVLGSSINRKLHKIDPKVDRQEEQNNDNNNININDDSSSDITADDDSNDIISDSLSGEGIAIRGSGSSERSCGEIKFQGQQLFAEFTSRCNRCSRY